MTPNATRPNDRIDRARIQGLSIGRLNFRDIASSEEQSHDDHLQRRAIAPTCGLPAKTGTTENSVLNPLICDAIAEYFLNNKRFRECFVYLPIPHHGHYPIATTYPDSSCNKTNLRRNGEMAGAVEFRIKNCSRFETPSVGGVSSARWPTYASRNLYFHSVVGAPGADSDAGVRIFHLANPSETPGARATTGRTALRPSSATRQQQPLAR